MMGDGWYYSINRKKKGNMKYLLQDPASNLLPPCPDAAKDVRARHQCCRPGMVVMETTSKLVRTPIAPPSLIPSSAQVNSCVDTHNQQQQRRQQ